MKYNNKRSDCKNNSIIGCLSDFEQTRKYDCQCKKPEDLLELEYKEMRVNIAAQNKNNTGVWFYLEDVGVKSKTKGLHIKTFISYLNSVKKQGLIVGRGDLKVDWDQFDTLESVYTIKFKVNEKDGKYFLNIEEAHKVRGAL